LEILPLKHFHCQQKPNLNNYDFSPTINLIPSNISSYAVHNMVSQAIKVAGQSVGWVRGAFCIASCVNGHHSVINLDQYDDTDM
jgi:hypothetical protein